jgi:glycine cleavage system transcriptional repressor
MQKAHAVVRAIGSDRIGIVEGLTTVVENFSCNIEESKMAVLGGEFAVMMLVSGDEQAIGSLLSCKFTGSAFTGLQIDVIRTDEAPSGRTGVPYLIETVSLDSPGIVHTVTSLLAREQINVEELETDSSSAPFTGSPMFTMRIRVNLKGPKQASGLKESLQQLGYDRDIDIRFRSLASVHTQ